MDYQDTLAYIYNNLPLFQQVGSSAFKEGLSNTHLLDAHFNHPHTRFHTIHVAGTNGKGSCSHTLAAILQAAGYKAGLYTSPHLLDFRERIRVNGQPVSEQYIVDFVARERSFFEPLHPSFFEFSTAMAFCYFAHEQVDVAVVEVGLGGRLDCTNIIHPDLCLITNISFDHTQFLGNTLAEIASEKAGIIKPEVPVVIGEAVPETKEVFTRQAQAVGAPIYFAEDNHNIPYTPDDYELKGSYQVNNLRTVATALPLLQQAGYQKVDKQSIAYGLMHVVESTGLMGRWQQLSTHPTLICDTGHNVGGITYIVQQLRQQTYKQLRIVIGMVNDKDIRGILSLLPTEAIYYFTRASVPRALDEHELLQTAHTLGLHGECYPDVATAVKVAQKESLPEDFIFVGGSNFIVADLLAGRDALNLH